MNKQIIYSITAASLLFSGAALAQNKEKTKDKKEENIGTEVVDVVRPYDATISDAFKVRELPNLDEDAEVQKKAIQYTINSFPVASTFVPEKGQAAAVEKEDRLAAFNNYVLFGLGNYLNLRGELFLSGQVNQTDYVAAMVKHLSSQGGIKDQLLDDYFSKTSADLTYGSKKDNLNWNVDLGGKLQTANWYGLPDFVEANNWIDPATVDEEQMYKSFYAGGKVEFNKGPVSSVKAQYKRFWDAQDSGEDRFVFAPQLQTAVGDQDVKVGLVLDYVNAKFEDFRQKQTHSFSHLNLGVEPSITFKDDNYSVQAGVGLYFSDAKVREKESNNFYIYPQVKASFNLVDNILVTYMGAEGGLRQNTYADFVERNPFVSPTMDILPTSEQYNLYFGLKGKLDNTISYNLRASYKNEDDKAFFVSNLYNANAIRAFEYGNSFGVTYGNLKTLNLFGELRFDFEKNVSIGLNAAYNHFSTDLQEAWNMPETKVGADIQIDITDRWFAGTEVFFVGERKDSAFNAADPLAVPTVKTLDSYVDWNLKVGYRPTKNWTAFLTGHNLLNQNYQQWNNFKVQGIQLMAGAIYKFDF